MLSLFRCGRGRLKDTDVGTEGVEWIDCEICKVCLRWFLCEDGVMSIGFIIDDKSKSSLLSDWTKGLVGGFSMKLDEYDDESEGARDRGLSIESGGGNRGSSWNGEKCRGGEVAIQGACSNLFRPDCGCSRPVLFDCRIPSVKSPLCNAERGRSICNPAWFLSLSVVEGRCESDMSGDGNNGEEFEALGEGFRGV